MLWRCGLAQFDDEYTALLGTKLPKNRMVPPMHSLGVLSRRNTSDWLNETTPIEYMPATLNWTAEGWVTPVADQVSTIGWAVDHCVLYWYVSMFRLLASLTN